MIIQKQLLLIASNLIFLFAGQPLDTADKKNDSAALTELGHHLFFEPRLSLNTIKSCASCHAPELAFTDGYRRSLGTSADLLQRNTPSLLNLSSCKTFNWANPDIKNIEQQLLHPLFNADPPELGMNTGNSNILQQLQVDNVYKKLLTAAGIKNLQWNDIVKSLAFYVGMLNARNSKYDQYLNGNVQLDADELKGMQLFFSPQLNCKSCHSGQDFNQPFNNAEQNFFNTGLYNISSNHDYADGDNGIATVTKQSSDAGKFRTPSLRNVAVTAPYFHDGSAATLEEVIDIYSNGGRVIMNGPYTGDGRLNPNKSSHIHSFTISQKEKKQLISFLYTFTDTSYLGNPLFTGIYKQPVQYSK